jgi:hypothetical protein
MSVSSGSEQHGSSLPAVSFTLGPELRWRRAFPGDERQLSRLRRWIDSLLPECEARDDVACVATELGTNAVRHTASGRGGWFIAEITWYRQVVRVAVADSGAPTGPQLIGDPFAEHGRGLVVVRGLSVRTGVVGDARGRLVWADIPWPDSMAAPGRAAVDSYEAAVRDAQAALAKRFGCAQAWFGRSTLEWWGLAGSSGLVTAPTAPELATKLARSLDRPRPAHPLTPGEGIAEVVADVPNR